jgi:hypothetical protein
VFKAKHAEIPILSDYSMGAGSDFWEKFPKNTDSCKVTTSIRVKKLSELVKETSEYMTCDEKARAEKVLYSLKKGAGSVLKGCVCPNGNPQ